MDLKNPRWMYAKAAMFVAIGLLSFAIVLGENPSLRTAACLILMIWAFSRAYYFVFYVIEKYVDAEYRFSGIISFLKYLAAKRKGRPQQQPERDK